MMMPWLWKSAVSGDSNLASTVKSASLAGCMSRGTPYVGGQTSCPCPFAGRTSCNWVPVDTTAASPYGLVNVHNPVSTLAPLKSSDTMPEVTVKVWSSATERLPLMSTELAWKW